MGRCDLRCLPTSVRCTLWNQGERPDATGLVRLEWKGVVERRVTPGRSPLEKHSPQDLRLVEEANRLDRELFEHATELFERAVEAAGPELAVEAEVLRRALRPDATPARDLPVHARVALARNEAKLADNRERRREKVRKLKKVQKTSSQRADTIRELKRKLRGEDTT